MEEIIFQCWLYVSLMISMLLDGVWNFMVLGHILWFDTEEEGHRRRTQKKNTTTSAASRLKKTCVEV
jgi:hypothetical protein